MDAIQMKSVNTGQKLILKYKWIIHNKQLNNIYFYSESNNMVVYNI